MNGLKRVVIALVDRHYHLWVGAQLLDIDSRTKTTTLGTDDNDMDIAAKS